MSAGKNPDEKVGILNRFLNFIEVAGNKLPDPAVLFFILMVAAQITVIRRQALMTGAPGSFMAQQIYRLWQQAGRS